MQLEYEVTNPAEKEEEPVFEYPLKEGDDENEALYASIFLVTLADLYKKYEGKPADFIIENIDKDADQLIKDWEAHTGKLDELFVTKSGKTLLDAGILPENLDKVKLPHGVEEVVLEQRTTLRGIIEELRNGLKAKAHYLKSRLAEKLYNTKSNFKRAVKRTNWTVQHGFRLAVEKAKRAAQIFLYGDPLAYWVTMHDGRVCRYCLALERDSPMKLSEMPYTPLHLRCRCEVVLAKDIDLTEEAVKLSLYQYER